MIDKARLEQKCSMWNIALTGEVLVLNALRVGNGGQIDLLVVVHQDLRKGIQLVQLFPGLQEPVPLQPAENELLSADDAGGQALQDKGALPSAGHFPPELCLPGGYGAVSGL